MQAGMKMLGNYCRALSKAREQTMLYITDTSLGENAYLKETAILAKDFCNLCSCDSHKSLVGIDEGHVRLRAVSYSDALFDAVHGPIFQLQ